MVSAIFENSCNSHHNKQQPLSIVIPSDSDGIQSINNQIKLQGETMNNLTETVYSPLTTHNSLKKSGATHVAHCDDIRSWFIRWCKAHTHVAHCDKSRRVAFTLAEVLITLGIIGVVAALTLPTVINNIKHKQLETAFKTAYSILSQTVINMKREDGEEISKTYATYNENYLYPKAGEFKEKFYKYSGLQVIGKCNYNGITIRNYNNTADADSYGVMQPTKANYDLLANGMCSLLLINNSLPTFYVDINGTKGPNLFGHDLFIFVIDSKDRLSSYKMSKLYTEEELEGENAPPWPYVAGRPCSVKSKQQGNGTGCTYYAIINQNPDNPSKGYWESLPR